jgi:hypothetical protein
MNYSRGGGVSATGGEVPETWRGTAQKGAGGIPYLKIMAAIIVLVLLGFVWLVLSGY